MWKWFKWVLLVVAIIIFGIGTTLYVYYFHWVQMNDEMVKNANNAIYAGVTITDDHDDFVIMGSNKEELNTENNLAPYNLGFFDVKSISLGADQNWLYYKYTFFDTIPKSAPDVNGDHIQAIGAKAELVNESGKEYGGMGTGFGWVPIIHIAAIDSYYFYGPTGIEWPESARYTGDGRNSKVYGGPGTNYIMGAFPLAKFGIKIGDTINIRFPMEVKSDKYTHAAVDVVGGSGKSPSLISWKVGSNTYQISVNSSADSGY